MDPGFGNHEDDIGIRQDKHTPQSQTLQDVSRIVPDLPAGQYLSRHQSPPSTTSPAPDPLGHRGVRSLAPRSRHLTFLTNSQKELSREYNAYRIGSTCARRYCFTALARRSPRARLYSSLPFSSQYPSIVNRRFVFAFRNAAAA